MRVDFYELADKILLSLRRGTHSAPKLEPATVLASGAKQSSCATLIEVALTWVTSLRSRWQGATWKPAQPPDFLALSAEPGASCG